MTQIVWAPTAKPFLTHKACGKISPKITIPAEEITNATYPEVRSSNKIEMAEFTQTLPIKREQSNKFPDFRTGKIVSA